MIVLIATLAGLIMFLPDGPAKKPKPECAPESVYVVIYRHLIPDQPWDMVIDDSTRTYDPGVKP